eukprot:3643870-Pleurochrysis_carterae.AAC.1
MRACARACGRLRRCVVASVGVVFGEPGTKLSVVKRAIALLVKLAEKRLDLSTKGRSPRWARRDGSNRSSAKKRGGRG